MECGEIGTLQIGINGNGSETEKDYYVSLIKRARVNFRSGRAFADMLPGLGYNRVSKLALKKQEADGKPENPFE